MAHTDRAELQRGKKGPERAVPAVSAPILTVIKYTWPLNFWGEQTNEEIMAYEAAAL